jgi:probable HAF family extracellular repeat protein
MKAKANLYRTLVVLWVVLVAAAVALFGVGQRTAEPQTTTPKMQVQDLGTLGGSSSIARGINSSGQVVGSSYTSAGEQHAFLYDEGATPKMQDLGTLGGSSSYATGINDSGKVVGSSYTSAGEQHGFLYDRTNGMKDLNDLISANSGETIYEATAINSDGKIAATGFKPVDMDPNFCGQESYSWGMYFAAVLTPATTATPTTYGVQDLGTLGADYSEAAGINGSGQVVGISYTSSCSYHAFLYDEGATPKMQDLGALGADYSHATSINDSGQVVGTSFRSSFAGSCSTDCLRAFLYDGSAATPEMQDLGTLGGDSRAWGINGSGTVVGSSYVSGSGDHGFLKESGQPMIDLNTLLPADSGWTIHDARAINTDGKIAATGHKDGVGTHALLLTPTSDSPPLDDTEAPPPPSITSPQNNSYDTDGSFSVAGSAEAGSTVELFEGTTSKGTTKADSSSGAWSIALSGLSEGAHTYFAKATDAAGNTSSASNSVTVTVDKSAPKVVDGSVIPKEDATGVDPTTDVTATSTEDMLASSINGTTFKLFRKGSTTKLAATVSYPDLNSPSYTAKLDPRDSLSSGVTYKAVVTTGAKDLAGNPLAQQKAWFFKVR